MMNARLGVAAMLVFAVAAPAVAQPAADPLVAPRPRMFSGTWRTDEAPARGTAVVRLTYDDLADPRPPAGVAVALVGYAAGGETTVVRGKTDARGLATFTGLATDGSIAYYALAQLPRNRKADRLVGDPLVLDPIAGARLVLSAEARTSPAPLLDERLPRATTPPPAPAKGKVWVFLQGAFEATTPIELVDAATGKVVARGVAAGSDVVLAVAPRAGQVLYADATAYHKHYRSAPFVTVADRGAHTTIMVYPQVMAQFKLGVEADDAELRASGQYHLLNNAWRPFGDVLPLSLPLPDGAQHVMVAVGADSDVAAPLTGGVITRSRPLPPGGMTYQVSFDVPASGPDIVWNLPLPFGSFNSQIFLDSEGITLEAPSDLASIPFDSEGRPYLGLDAITRMPGTALTFTIHPKKVSKADAALARACRPLLPDRRTTLRGKVAPDFTLARPDGKRLKLSSLRGRPVLVNLMASWDQLSAEQRPKLAALGQAVPDLRVVMLASDDDPARVVAAVGARSPFEVVLDPPAPGANIGQVTTAWGVKLLPESFLVDRKGVVRFYFANARDWSSPEAIACVKAVAAIR
jgi:peroxiredoxin